MLLWSPRFPDSLHQDAAKRDFAEHDTACVSMMDHPKDKPSSSRLVYIPEKMTLRKQVSESETKQVSNVFIFKVKPKPGGVQEAVKEAIKPLWKSRLFAGRKIFVKVNLISSELVPGQCTSPLVLDEVLKELTDNGCDVTFGDADLAAARQCEKAAEVWGHKKLAREYNARFQNLSRDKFVNAKINGHVFKTLAVPRSVYESDYIVSLPVMKTHCLTGITCALKHFWGVVPRVRHQYHLVVDEAIADITQLIRPKLAFTLVDGTVAMEGDGPRTGIPKQCDIVMSSSDPVALDAAVARYMDVPLPRHVVVAAKRGLGTLDYTISGEETESNSFKPPNPDKQPIFKWEMAFRKTAIKPLIFDTPIFEIFALIATRYNTFWYYQLHGKKHARRIAGTWYGKELARFVRFW
jgi:uncharacterized protein (DUF362 family)